MQTDFRVKLGDGLSAKEAAARLEEYGKNELEEEEPTSIWELIWEQFDDPLVQILLAAAFLSFGFAVFESDPKKIEEEGWLMFVEPFVILLILFINAGVGVWQESQAESSLEALKQMQSLHSECLRGGKWVAELDSTELVPGDIVKGARAARRLLLQRARLAPLLTRRASFAARSQRGRQGPGGRARHRAGNHHHQGGRVVADWRERDRAQRHARDQGRRHAHPGQAQHDVRRHHRLQRPRPSYRLQYRHEH